MIRWGRWLVSLAVLVAGGAWLAAVIVPHWVGLVLAGALGVVGNVVTSFWWSDD